MLLRPQPGIDELAKLNRINRTRLSRMIMAGVALVLAVIGLAIVAWFDTRGLGLILGINILLIFAIAVFDQNWRRCPRCNFSFTPNLIRTEIEDTRRCLDCGLDVDLLDPPPV